MIVVRSEPIGDLDRHGEISSAFEVSTVFDVELVEGGLRGVGSPKARWIRRT